MQVPKLKPTDKLPLTCSRAGACCHGNTVKLNPWELHALAISKKLPAREFRDSFTDFGGIQIKFNGKLGWQDKPSCSQYIKGFGCSVHEGRPLACRLFPLGRQIQNNVVQYIYQGKEFPCVSSCPEVLNLPKLTVQDYLKGQNIDQYAIAQDGYLEVMENLADIAFELLLDTGLSKSGDKKTIPLWRKMGQAPPQLIIKRLGTDWIDLLMVPDITINIEDSNSFVKQHFELLQVRIQEKVKILNSLKDFHDTSVLIMGLTLLLARSIGAEPEDLANHWADTALSFGALE